MSLLGEVKSQATDTGRREFGSEDVQAPIPPRLNFTVSRCPALPHFCGADCLLVEEIRRMRKRALFKRADIS